MHTHHTDSLLLATVARAQTERSTSQAAAIACTNQDTRTVLTRSASFLWGKRHCAAQSARCKAAIFILFLIALSPQGPPAVSLCFSLLVRGTDIVC